METELGITSEQFQPESIARPSDPDQALQAGIVARPDVAIGDLPLVTEAERRQLLIEWNRPDDPPPPNVCVHELFEQIVERHSDAPALVFEGRQLTYREVNRVANRIARRLIEAGVGPDRLVAVCQPRSLMQICGLLGILKAGGAYLPLDPQLPELRLRQLLADACPVVALVDVDSQHRLSQAGVPTICLDDQILSDREPFEANPRVDMSCLSLAYVIYTSGSTGIPKGVEIPHQGVTRLVRGNDYADFDSSLPVAHLAPLSFDASTFEIWGPLLNGGLCVLVPEGAPDLARLETCLITNNVRTLWLTASLFNMIVDERPQTLRGIRQLLTGGEALSVPHVRRAFSVLPEGIRLINGYGPTENTTFSCCHEIVQVPAENAASIPIGKPIRQTHAYVLDDRRQLVPIGVAGELLLGGAGLARGYLNRPELTAEKFVVDPFSDQPGGRLYRTGDLVRWRADGNLEFLGRMDHQVKLRGFRIELGEIEATLARYPGVKQAVVVLREDRPGDKRLVAYVVIESAAASFNTAELRGHVLRALPEYMVPSAFVVLNALPLNPNGKIDRKALPAPEVEAVESGDALVAPSTPVEELLAEIWEKVLGRERVGIHDNFFELGGHSLLAIKLIVRLRDAFGVDLPVRALFDAPTVARLAAAIAEYRADRASIELPPLVPILRDGPLPLSFAQQRLWFLEQLEGELTAYNISDALRLRGELDVDALRQALQEVVRRHEPLRTVFISPEGQPMAVVLPPGDLELPLIDLESLAAEEHEAAIAERRREFARRPFDLSRDQMLRGMLLRLSGREHLLLVCLHHIASDGQSQELLWRELGVLYGAFVRGEPSPLATLPIQYVDYAVWQRQTLQGARLEQLTEYWRGQLAGVSVLELPTDFPRSAEPTYRGAELEFVLGADLVGQLEALSRDAGVTLHMTLLAAFQVLLSRYSGQVDIAVGVPIAGRNHSALERQIGFFVNTLVLRSDLSGNPTVRELLERVRGVSLGAYDHQALPFEKLVEELQPERHRNRNPLVQVLFQLLDFGDRSLELAGLDVIRQPGDGSQVRFDFEVYLWRHPDGLHGTIMYSTDLFRPETIVRLAGHFQVLLAGMVAHPDRPIGNLPLLTEAELRRVVVEWNQTESDLSLDGCVHELFEEQAERTPDAVAAVFHEQALNYRDLNRRANQLAHHLIGLGVGPEVLVGLCVERSLEMLVGVLGILKAGGAYVPLDPTLPDERLTFLLEDTRASLVLTQQSLNERPWLQAVRRFCLDSEVLPAELDGNANPKQNRSTEQLAYVLYTSGSTGRPKGVAMPHGPLVNLVRWQRDNLPL
ncbi:MAG: amino acid adenylation domain-containing protein, partial [Planctomycetota bacterium]|nr:amino acid adenylation domain-containing protein [Planctomycetota bacterium]